MLNYTSIKCYRDMEFFGGGHSEKEFLETSKVKFVTIETNVSPHGSYDVEKINKANVNTLKTLYALSKDANEYHHLSTLFDQVFRSKNSIPNPKRYNLEAFCVLILGIREINSISPITINISEVKSILQLENEFLKNKKYLYFSKQNFWKEFCEIGEIDLGRVLFKTTQKNCISNNFSIDEIKKLIRKNIDLQGSNLERVAHIILMESFLSSEFHFEYVISKMDIYFKNSALLKEYDIDFDKLNLKKKEDVFEFLSNVNNTFSYKILNKILQRLNSQHRQTIKNNKIIFESFLQYAKTILNKSIDLKQIEPVLSRIHTYRDINILLNALYGIISEFNIYNAEKESKKINGAKTIYFNEADQIAILKISTFKAMKVLGSPSWCVQNLEHKFDSYTSGFKNFYIFIDAKSKNRDRSKIGFTIYPNGTVLQACDFSNKSLLHYLDSDFYDKYGKYMKGFFNMSARKKLDR